MKCVFELFTHTPDGQLVAKKKILFGVTKPSVGMILYQIYQLYQ